jgi:hypothetical protein
MFGVSCNFAAVMDNGGRMPVHTNLYVMNTDTHFSFVNQQEINHPFLADRFDIGKNIYSIGDFLIFLGVLSFMTNASLYLRWKFQRKL